MMKLACQRNDILPGLVFAPSLKAARSPYLAERGG